MSLAGFLKPPESLSCCRLSLQTTFSNPSRMNDRDESSLSLSSHFATIMAHKILLTLKAKSERDRLLPVLRRIVNAKLKELAEDPISLSRKTVSPPFPPGGMMA